MRKTIILLLCCGMLFSMVGCGGNTAPPPTESPPTTVSKTVITETPSETTPPITAIEPTEEEKEPVSTENKDQATEPTTTVPTATENPKTEIKSTITNTTSQLTESETTTAEPPKEEVKAETIQETVSEPETTKHKFDIHYWITFAKEYAVSIGLTLDSEAIECWDNPIRAGAHCIYLERDIQSRLNRYAKDEDITDVWIWAEATGNDCYDIYIGYA